MLLPLTYERREAPVLTLLRVSRAVAKRGAADLGSLLEPRDRGACAARARMQYSDTPFIGVARSESVAWLHAARTRAAGARAWLKHLSKHSF